MARAPHHERSTGWLARRRGAIAALAGALAAVGVLIAVPVTPVLAAPCTEPQNAPADPALRGGFEIDGNLCLNTTGTTGTRSRTPTPPALVATAGFRAPAGRSATCCWGSTRAEAGRSRSQRPGSGAVLPGLRDNVGSYDTTLACDHGVVPGADGSFPVTGDLAGATVLGTVTNARTTGAITLRKIWRNGAPGDAGRLTISGAASPAENTSVVPASPPPVFDDTNHAAVTDVWSGQTVMVAEVLDPANAGRYDAVIACDNGANGSQSITFGIAAEPGAIECTVTNTARPAAPPTTGTPRLRTETSQQRVKPGKPFHDRLHVRGLAGGQGATAVAQLYGPFPSRAAATCQDAFQVRSQTLHVHNGTTRTRPVRLETPGVYTWKVRILANAANQAAAPRCGEVAETTVVAKPAYVAPEIVGGFSGTVRPAELERGTPMTVQMPAIGLRATVRSEGIVRGRMTLPNDVAAVGWLRKSAGVGDQIGTAVVAGHVSDRHDRPGAMVHLNRARLGQIVTVVRAGVRYRFEVVSKATFDCNHRLSQRYFATTGRHQLALVTCTHKIVHPDGHFHYTRYVVVVAKQLR
jgi:hypothetical protein